MIQKLINLLVQLHLKPTSGFGRTTIIWKAGTIVMLFKEEEIEPGSIN